MVEKTNIIISCLSIIFILVLGFVVFDLYFRDKHVSSVEPKEIPQQPPAKQTSSNGALSNMSNFTSDSCIKNTKDNAQCKDCCDCLIGVDSTIRTSCRDTCAVNDFSKNSNILTITVPSLLGKEGNYSVCVAKGSTDCKTCCENQIGLQCGDYQYCRTACNNAFGDLKHNITAGENL